MTKRHRISKSEWTARGGLSGTDVCRIMRSGHWTYWRIR